MGGEKTTRTSRSLPLTPALSPSGGEGAAALALILLLVATPARAEPGAVETTLEGGAEYDTNAHRVETLDGDDADIVGSALVRFGARLRGRWKLGGAGRFQLGAVGGGKLFSADDARSESVGVIAVDGRYDYGLRSRRAVVSAAGSVYSAIPLADAAGGTSTARTFDVGDASASLTLVGPDSHRVTATAGARAFRYDLDHDFDWQADHYGVRYSTTIWRGDDAAELEEEPRAIDVSAGYRLERRGYDGLAFANTCGPDVEPDPSCFSPTRFARADLFHSATAELVYTGARIYGVRYELQVTDSNSFGQSFVRHRVELSLTTELGAEVFLTAKGVVLFNVFLDPLLLARDVDAQTFLSIDDENRNSLVLHATRDVAPRWAVEARYSLYGNEFATSELSFRRQTGYLGLVYRTGG